MRFQEPLKVKVDKEAGTTDLSLRTTDHKVEIFTFPTSTFEKMVAEFQAMIRD